jgi:small redox-active disulfide protein 2
MHRVEVLGPGCTRCKETFRVVQQVVESAGIQVELVKEESYERMVALGVMSTPAVVIDGAVVVSGRIPKAAELRELLGIA